jgi:hypothetical protein
VRIAGFRQLWWQSRIRHRLRLLGATAGRRRRRTTEQPFEPDEVALPAPRYDLGRRSLAIALGLALGFGAAEVALRIPGLPLPLDLDTYLFNCYGPDYEGARATFWSEPLGIHLSKPNFTQQCAWNGHHWMHRSDAWGMRNQETRERTDIVLLGDSMVYGHGVDQQQTVAHFLRQLTGLSVSNLAFMGDSAPEYLAKLRNFGLPLRPRLAIVFFFENDLDDLRQREESHVRQLVEGAGAPEAQVYPRDVLLAAVPEPAPLHERIKHRLLSWRALRYLLLLRDDARAVTPWSFTGAQLRPNLPLPPPEPSAEERLALSYVHVALQLMKSSCERAGTRLMVAYIPGLTSRRARVDRLLLYNVRELAASLDLPFLDATSVILDVSGQAIAGTRLENDGHLTELGHHRLADLVGRFVARRKLLAEP